jgi:hypothetical protein
MDRIKTKILFSLLVSFASILLMTSCNETKFLYKEIQRYGYIPYQVPLESAGPGTIVGGAPKSLSLVAEARTCFPDSVGESETGLRKIDRTTLPKRNYTVRARGRAVFDLINLAGMGNAVVNAGVEFNRVKGIELIMEGAQIEYLDSINLTRFYQGQMDAICKDYLDKVGFIIQAIRVDKLNFKFYSSNGGAIKLDFDKIEKIVDISADVAYSIENEVSLVINSPKYIGMQLGRLIKEDDGISLYRSSRVRNNKFVFEDMTHFDYGPQQDIEIAGFNSSIDEHIVEENNFEEINEVDGLDFHSVFSI